MVNKNNMAQTESNAAQTTYRFSAQLSAPHLALDLRGGDRLLVANGGGLGGLRDDGGRLGLGAGLCACACVCVIRGAG